MVLRIRLEASCRMHKSPPPPSTHTHTHRHTHTHLPAHTHTHFCACMHTCVLVCLYAASREPGSRLNDLTITSHVVLAVTKDTHRFITRPTPRRVPCESTNICWDVSANVNVNVNIYNALDFYNEQRRGYIFIRSRRTEAVEMGLELISE